MSFSLPFIFYQIALVFITALQVDASIIVDNLETYNKKDISKVVIGLILAYLVLTIIRNNNKEHSC